MNAPKRTALFQLHQRLGAKMTVFGGFEMPLSYCGIIEEHLAVRAAAGIFDLSHMGEFEIAGPRALELLESTLTNSAARLRDGQEQYTIMCADDGGVIDDLIVYRLGAERFLLCVNASNIDADRDWLASHNPMRAQFADRSDETALIAVQGPAALGILERLASFPIARVKRFHFAVGKIAEIECMAARTGYTGEDGFELFTAWRDGARLFEALLDAGTRDGLVPVGLGARDTLRLEAALPLYGHELDRATTPLQAGLGAFVKLGRGFIGEPALSTERAVGKHLIGLMTDDRRSIARQGYRILSGGRDAGVVTSGTFAPTLNRPIAMGYVAGGEIALAGGIPGALEVEIRNRRVPATVTPLPFYRRNQTRVARRPEGAVG